MKENLPVDEYTSDSIAPEWDSRFLMNNSALIILYVHYNIN